MFTIKQWRMLKGISAEELARRVGTSPNTIFNWEKEPGKVTMANAHKIAEAMDLTVNEIIFLPTITTK